MTSSNPIRFSGSHCELSIEAPADGVVVLTISGRDVGEFGAQPMEQLASLLSSAAPVELYIDARDTKGASIDVSGAWARWLHQHRASFHHISMLTGSRFVEITADFVRNFAGLQGVMRIYLGAEAFDTALFFSLAQARVENANC